MFWTIERTTQKTVWSNYLIKQKFNRMSVSIIINEERRLNQPYVTKPGFVCAICSCCWQSEEGCLWSIIQRFPAKKIRISVWSTSNCFGVFSTFYWQALSPQNATSPTDKRIKNWRNDGVPRTTPPSIFHEPESEKSLNKKSYWTTSV